MRVVRLSRSGEGLSFDGRTSYGASITLRPDGERDVAEGVRPGAVIEAASTH
jgi:hypothetical protein